MAKGGKSARSRRNFGGLASFAHALNSQETHQNVAVDSPVVEEKSAEETTPNEPGPSAVRKHSEDASADPNAKRRRVGVLPSAWAKYDASHLVTHYDSIAEVPSHLQKYFSQRHRYFSLYEQGCLLDEEGWYSVTPEKIAQQIAERCRCDTVLDAFCGVGGNAIALAATCHRVIAIDNNRQRLEIARHNAAIYGVAERIEFIHADFLDFARSYTQRTSARRIDVVFLSPPWGGPDYLEQSPAKQGVSCNDEEQSCYSLKSIRPIPGDELFHLARRITHNIAFFLPRNVDIDEISKLLTSDSNTKTSETGAVDLEGEMVEVEEEYMSGKLKAVTCYFGGLASGQEDLF